MPFGKKSLELLAGYKTAADTLGEPIKMKEIVRDDQFYHMDENTAKVKCVVEGKKRLADLFVYASKKGEQQDWRIDALEIKYKGSLSTYKFYGIKS